MSNKAAIKTSTTCNHLLLSEKLLQSWLENDQREKKRGHHFKNCKNEIMSYMKSMWRWIGAVRPQIPGI